MGHAYGQFRVGFSATPPKIVPRRVPFSHNRGWLSGKGQDAQGSRNVALVVHTLVQDTDDVDAVVGEAIEQNVRAGGILAIVRPHFGTFPAERRVVRYRYRWPGYSAGARPT